MVSSRFPRVLALFGLAPVLFASCGLLPGVLTQGSEQATSYDGLAINYEVEGAGSPTLVFVHGWACNRGHWRAQMEEFRTHHRVVAVDLGGHGESGKDREIWTIESLSRDLCAVLDHLDLKDVLLVGHSMGGPVSLMAAARRPGRVIGVIGADTIHDAEMTITAEMIGPYIAAMESDFEKTCGSTARGAFPNGGDVDPELIGRVEADMLATGPDVTVGLMRAFTELDVKKILADCPVPVKCINAATPNETRVEVNRKYSPAFEVILMEGVSHFLMMERPGEFNRHLRTLISGWSSPAAAAR
ncbi:MAG: alpha/beta hydrolase [Planctomycetota bacterium]